MSWFGTDAFYHLLMPQGVSVALGQLNNRLPGKVYIKLAAEPALYWLDKHVCCIDVIYTPLVQAVGRHKSGTNCDKKEVNQPLCVTNVQLDHTICMILITIKLYFFDDIWALYFVLFWFYAVRIVINF